MSNTPSTKITVGPENIEEHRPEIEPRGRWVLVFHYEMESTSWEICSLTRETPDKCRPSCGKPTTIVTVPSEEEAAFLKQRAELLDHLSDAAEVIVELVRDKCLNHPVEADGKGCSCDQCAKVAVYYEVLQEIANLDAQRAKPKEVGT